MKPVQRPDASQVPSVLDELTSMSTVAERDHLDGVDKFSRWGIAHRRWVLTGRVPAVDRQRSGASLELLQLALEVCDVPAQHGKAWRSDGGVQLRFELGQDVSARPSPPTRGP